MKVRPSVKAMCSKCKTIIRKKKGDSKSSTMKRTVFVICTNPKHKQRQG